MTLDFVAVVAIAFTGDQDVTHLSAINTDAIFARLNYSQHQSDLRWLQALIPPISSEFRFFISRKPE